MQKYAVEFEPGIERQLRRVHRADVENLRDRARALGSDPRPDGCTKLRAEQGYRIKMGDYRITYRIDDKERVVIITRIGQREGFYRK